MSAPLTPEPSPSQGATWVALLVALAGSAGSLWLSLGEGLQACALCYYQRSFILAIVGVLFLGLLTGAGKQTSLSLLALPLAAAGLSVAGFHFYLEKSGKMECPKGLYDLGTAPQQSVAVFTMLTVLLLADVLNRPAMSGKLKFAGCLLALLLGGGFAAGCITSATPPPQSYSATEKIKGCRQPFGYGKDKAK